MQISSLSFILAAVCSFLFHCQNHIIFFVLCVFFLKLIPFVTLSIMHLQPQNSLHLLFWKCVNKGNETKKKVVTIKKRSVFLSVFFEKYSMRLILLTARCKMSAFSVLTTPQIILWFLFTFFYTYIV